MSKETFIIWAGANTGTRRDIQRQMERNWCGRNGHASLEAMAYSRFKVCSHCHAIVCEHDWEEWSAPCEVQPGFFNKQRICKRCICLEISAYGVATVPGTATGVGA